MTAACGNVASSPADAPLDAPADSGMPAAAPALVTSAATHAVSVATVHLPLTMPATTDGFVLVSVAIGSNCSDTAVPTVASVAYAGIALGRVTAITGTPCAAAATRSEQWALAGPAIGTTDVVVTLSGSAATVHVGALAISGVDPVMPVRASATGNGSDIAASVIVESAPGDLVVSTVGQGDGIAATGAGQTRVFLLNVGGSNTLDNSGASTAPGAAPMVAMNWTFGSSDQWQMIASSIRPRS